MCSLEGQLTPTLGLQASAVGAPFPPLATSGGGKGEVMGAAGDGRQAWPARDLEGCLQSPEGRRKGQWSDRSPYHDVIAYGPTAQFHFEVRRSNNAFICINSF